MSELEIMLENKRKLLRISKDTIRALEQEETNIKDKLDRRESEDKVWDSMIQVIKIIRPEIIEYDLFHNSKNHNTCLTNFDESL